MPAIKQNKHFLQEARDIIKDLFIPNPFIYWVDFLFYLILGWSAFIFTLKFPTFSLGQLCCYAISCLAFYRAAIFIHELAHLRKNTFRLFRFVWNMTCGFPLMVPSFVYRGVHNDHHKSDIYGTKSDGEYLPFAAEGPYRIILYPLLAFILPLLLATRFIILAPLSYLHRGLRHYIWKKASSLAVDLSYDRPEYSVRDDKTWQLQEFFAFLYGITAILLMGIGVLSYKIFVLWYLVLLMVFILNSLRTLAAHCYRNPGNYVVDLIEQYLDSVNVPGNLLLTASWAPVGLRYHATHHLFPSMPYHALGKAHRRLIRELSDNTLYLQTIRKSLWDALWTLWKEARLFSSRACPDSSA